MKDTRPLLIHSECSFPKIKRGTLDTLQVNLGYLCNLSCVHCHVNAGPTRTELMSKETIDIILKVLEQREIKLLDLTGGAPEMNPHFRYLVEAAREMDVTVIDRCNLTILNEPGYEDLAEFLAEQGVHIVASLPCYSQENVDQQRGKGVFDGSILALQKLNELGYAREDHLMLDLVYNPQGPNLPPSQEALQGDYKTMLKSNFDVDFNSLLTITNMPISRFGAVLLAKGQYDEYMTLLKDNYAEENLSSVMCRTIVSLSWEGYVYDCDFNQMLELPTQLAHHAEPSTLHVKDLLEETLLGNDIQIGDHCFGCTAGQGSSCSGAL